MLNGSREEALLAVDLYNRSRQPRRLEAFLVHMHIAWTYLLQAEFVQDGIDIRVRLSNGRIERINGEARTWGLSKCVDERWKQDSPVKRNLEMTIGLRNKIEHRYYETLEHVVSGYAQSLLLNFETEISDHFGDKYSLGDELRFPIFVGSIVGQPSVRINALRKELPITTRDYLAQYESGLDDSILSDFRYELRINLIQKSGPKTQADQVTTFVRESDLTEEQRAMMQDLGRTGQVIVREHIRPVANAGLLKPGEAMKQVASQIPYIFNQSHFTRGWKKLACRPKGGDPNPARTEEKYCVYDAAHGDYLYKRAMVDKLVREAKTDNKFREFFDVEPVPKS